MDKLLFLQTFRPALAASSYEHGHQTRRENLSMTSRKNLAYETSVEDYLKGELHSEIRHEFVGGQVYAMVGASDRHGLIVNAMAFALTPAARERKCQLFTSDMKVRLAIAGQEIFYYPDLVLSCDPNDRETYFRERPCLIVEVLSEATERIDRREKLLAYQTISSLREYILVAQNQARLEIYRHGNDWRPEIITEGRVTLECLDANLTIEAIYEDVAR